MEHRFCSILFVAGFLILVLTCEAKKSVVDMDEVELEKIYEEWDVSVVFLIQNDLGIFLEYLLFLRKMMRITIQKKVKIIYIEKGWKREKNMFPVLIH